MGADSEGPGVNRPTPDDATPVGGILLRGVVLLALLTTWQVLATVAPSPFLPTFTATAVRFVETWIATGDALTTHLVPSLLRLGIGLGLAAALGIVAGVAIGRSERLREVFDPVIQFLRAIPPTALVPLGLVLLGVGDSMKVAIIAMGVVWPILLNTVDGVRWVDPLLLETAQAYRIDRRDTLLRIVLPSAAPRIFAGLRIALSMAIVLMVISEMVATLDGVGFTIVQAQRSFRILDMWAGILLLGLLGFTLNAGLTALERRVLRWHRAAQGGMGT
jgi:ABC-type nitrate/sulfonate/bicarbonate transport system permease component